MDVLSDSQYLLLGSYISSIIDPSFPLIGCSSCPSSNSLFSSENDYVCSNSSFNTSPMISNCSIYAYTSDGHIKCDTCESNYIITKEKDRCLDVSNIQWGGSTSLLTDNTQ